LWQVAQGLIQPSFKSLHRQRPSGQPVPVFHSPFSSEKTISSWKNEHRAVPSVPVVYELLELALDQLKISCWKKSHFHFGGFLELVVYALQVHKSQEKMVERAAPCPCTHAGGPDRNVPNGASCQVSTKDAILQGCQDITLHHQEFQTKY